MEVVYGRDRIEAAGHGVFGRLAPCGAPKADVFTCHEASEQFRGAFENVARMLLAYAALENDALLLHSAAVIAQSGVLVFPGHSGAGKTTLSRLAEQAGLAVASDDLNVVVFDAGRCFLDALPFRGDLGGRSPPGRHLLSGILLHQKADRHRVSLATGAQCVARLLACTPYVNLDPFRRERLTTLIEQIVENTRCAVLDFMPDAGVWRTIDTEFTHGYTDATTASCA